MPDTHEAIKQYGSTVYRTAYAYVRSKHDADDIFQEVFLRYHRSAPLFESDQHEKAWLLKVTLNCAKSFFRSPWRQRMIPLEDTYVYTNPKESEIDDALAQLPAKYRTVVHLHYYEGYTTEEIAEITGTKPATVRTQLTRARQKLANLLKGDI